MAAQIYLDFWKEKMTEQSGQLIRRFFHLQEERVQTYVLFEEGFQGYLSAAPNYNFPLFRQLVHEITETLNKISKEIIEIEVQLKTASDPLTPVAVLIRKIQDEEENKLESTVKFHLARKDEVDHPQDENCKEEVSRLQQSLQEIKEKINESLEELKYEAEDLLLQT